ncbi:hypothetical protein ABW19_dt0207057 [Dactylella cylindrospora]|nr:hypothetical protein ABW19_dt0207057 [Dactylella cylindrospora]
MAGSVPSEYKDEASHSSKSGSHGTAVISKIVGSTVGIAPHSEIVPVKYIDGRGEVSVLSDLDSYLKMLEHRVNNLDMGCIVNFSWGFEKLEKFNTRHLKLGDFIGDIFDDILHELGRAGCIIVVAAGNDEKDGKPLPITSIPTIFAEGNKKMVVVGGVNHETMKNEFQTAEYVQVSAVATNVRVAKGFASWDDSVDFSKEHLDYADGTSYAAPLIAGMLAGFISQGIEDPIDELYRNAYKRGGTPGKRTPEYPPVAWNGVESKEWALAWDDWYQHGRKNPSNRKSKLKRHTPYSNKQMDYAGHLNEVAPSDKVRKPYISLVPAVGI